jgi:putative ABC transport system ATP-binding protein
MTGMDAAFRKHEGVEPVIHAAGVGHWFGAPESRHQVLFSCHLDLYPGEVAILTGPSGSGKTTLLTLIGALRALEEGSLNVLGRELKGLPPPGQVALRREIGFIFQAHNLIDSLTAADNVRLAMQLKDGYTSADYAQRPVSVLRDLGMEDFAPAKPGRLSGGQRQRVAIARALVNEPRIILADEPTAALDKASGKQVLQLLQQLANQRGCTILIVTHDARVIDAANRIVNMVDGRIAADVDIEQQALVCDFLKKCSVFADSSPSLLADIAQHMRPESFAAGSSIVTEGDEGDKFYVLIQGRCDVLHEGEERSERLTTLGPGDFFGELALLRQLPRAATVRAIEPVRVLSLSKERFLHAVQADSSLSRHLRKMAAISF